MKGNEYALVSVGIPTYNRADKLEKTLKSLCDQTYANLEIIISDNCSTDENVQEVMREYCDSNSNVFCYQQSKNIGAARNFKFVQEKANGEFFLWLADDDVLSPNYIKSCVQYLIENLDYVLVAGSAKFRRPDNSKYDGEITCLADASARCRILKYLKGVDGNSVFYGVYRTEIVSQVTLQNILAGDWLLIAEVAMLGKVATITDAVIYRDATHLFLDDPWGRLCLYYTLPMWAKKFPEIWIGLELRKGIRESNILRRGGGRDKLSNDVFKLMMFDKYKGKVSFRRIPLVLAALIFHPIVLYRRHRSKNIDNDVIFQE